MIAKKAPNPVDKHVGSRVRMRRMMLAMSQEKLGDALGLTFQQVQKYEKGTNRIGASRLQQISHILQVPVSFFFEGAPTVALGPRADGMGEAPSQQFVLTVEATDTLGQTDSDTIEVAVPGYLAPPRRADASDADAVGAWPSRHLLGSRLGPNRNGRQW